MITAVLFVPAAPWLIPSVAPSLLAEQSTLARSVRAQITATDAGEWAALGVAGARSRSRWDRELPVEFGPDPYRGGATTPADPLPGSYWVARALLGPRLLTAGSLAPAAVEHGSGGEHDSEGEHGSDVEHRSAGEHAVAAGLQALAADTRRHALLVTADGSTGHGEHAPGAPDDRAAAYDTALHSALAGGPGATRAWLRSPAGSHTLAAELGATLPTALRAVLAQLDGAGDPDGASDPDHHLDNNLDGAGWDVSADDLVVPYGVGHHVVRWSRR